MRLYFATDVHGSETCWRKFLNAAQHYKADVLVLAAVSEPREVEEEHAEPAGGYRAVLRDRNFVSATIFGFFFNLVLLAGIGYAIRHEQRHAEGLRS